MFVFDFDGTVPSITHLVIGWPFGLALLSLQIKSYKYAENKTFADCVKAIVPVFLDSIQVLPSGPGGVPAYVAALKKAADTWITLFKLFLNDTGKQAHTEQRSPRMCKSFAI